MSTLARANVTPAQNFPVDSFGAGAPPPTLNISTQTVIKTSPGRLVRIDVAERRQRRWLGER
jgi:hypothetical protein